MIAFEVISISLCALTVLVNGLLVFLPFKAIHPKPLKKYPKVSVLIAARNEAKNIESCLQSVLAQNYPDVEVCLGDDASEDETLVLATSLAAKDARLRVFKVDKSLGKARGKSNVLAQLAQKAEGDVLVITDADMQHPPNWLKFMLEKTGDADMLTGMTVIKGAGLWASFQKLDWMLALGMVKLVNDYFFPVTAMGNNMLIKKDAYLKTGGYENLDFSITEDFQLMKEVLKNGGKCLQDISAEITCFTKPLPSFVALLNQRKRWMTGALKLPFFMVFLLGAQALFFPAILILFVLNLPLAVGFLTVKFVLQATIQFKTARQSGEKLDGPAIVLFEIYSACLSLALLIFYWVPLKIDWKGRKYGTWKP